MDVYDNPTYVVTMVEGCSNTTSLGGEDSSSRVKCKNCGELSVRKDYIGSQECMVCENCGCCDEVTFSDSNQEWCPPSATQYSVGGPTRQGRFHAPRDRTKQREMHFIGMVREMASKVGVPKHEATLVEEEGLNLMRNNQLLGSNTQLKRSAAGLVYIALERHTRSVSYKEVAPRLGTSMSAKSLGRAVRELKKRPGLSRAISCSNEEKIEAVINKLPGSPPAMDTRIKAKKMALDLKEICAGVRVQNHSSYGVSADCAILIITLETIEKKRKTEQWIDEFAKNAKLAPGSLRTGLSYLRAMLVTVAGKIPSLGSMLESKAITSRNIQQYVPIIVKNKILLVDKESQEESSDSDEASGVDTMAAGCSGVSAMPPVAASFEDDGDGNLSDLDDEIKEYIATKKEVAKKQRMQTE